MNRPESMLSPSPSHLTRGGLAPALVLALLLAGGARAGHAFCGFYVAKADTHLYNRASQVVLVRDGDRTVMTMANDFKGEPKEFAMVIPVPVLLQRGQIHVADKALIDHLDAGRRHAWSSTSIPTPARGGSRHPRCARGLPCRLPPRQRSPSAPAAWG